MTTRQPKRSILTLAAAAGVALGTGLAATAAQAGDMSGCNSVTTAALPAAKAKSGIILVACTPCAPKACTPCNPCAAKGCAPCNPCAAKSN